MLLLALHPKLALLRVCLLPFGQTLNNLLLCYLVDVRITLYFR
jgi:hypothetical protein